MESFIGIERERHRCRSVNLSLRGIWTAKLQEIKGLRPERHTMSKNNIAGVTGRDGAVKAKALLYAISTIQSLPVERQERSDMCDMCAIARTIDPASLAKLIFDTQAHTGTKIDIWPDSDADLDEKGIREKKAFKFTLNTHVEELERQWAEFIASKGK
ncbi:hypothetical protein [Agrobacterium tumefaciens]|uniref:hypothetical protein n=1 Tax=Agrobacterium tumefaciens TaxID=358 RepID=UPI0011773BAB